MKESGRIKISQLAGTWYEENAARLAQRIDEDLQTSAKIPPGDVRALILPHAGYRFSGAVAAHGAATLRGKSFRRVMLLGPSHRTVLPQSVALPDAAAIETPLGRVPVDHGALQKLAQTPLCISCPEAFEEEHSLEIQLPLLQRSLGEFALVPLLIGQVDSADKAADIARTLMTVADTQHTLIVASSDFTHYGRSFGYVPFSASIAENIRRLDDGAFAAIAGLDTAGFLDYCNRTGITICGRDPIAVLLSMLPRSVSAHKVDYATSGHLTGDFSHCVSYLAAAFIEPSAHVRHAPTANTEAAQLNDTEKKALKELAIRAINAYFESGREPTIAELDCKPTPAMLQKRGAFVTLSTPNNELRGCIGEILPLRPLYEAVAGNAIRAAFYDSRFTPLRADEWPSISLEISALTPPRPIAKPRDILLGSHGIVLKKGNASAVYLPRVPVDQQWSLEQTLSSLSCKAGLPPDAWEKGATLSVFEAEVFA